jgi:ribosomal protein S18 acetylase RimI-like enzyme
MHQLDDGFRLRCVQDPKTDEALRDFSSGTGRHARAVNDLIRRQITGEARHKARILVMESDSPLGDTMGVSAWRTEDLPGTNPMGRSDIYIHALGRSAPFRAHLLPDGRSVGRALLAETLIDIVRVNSENPMPLIWAYVARTNHKGHKLYDAFGFQHRRLRGGKRFAHLPLWVLPVRGDAIRLRPARPLSQC